MTARRRLVAAALAGALGVAGCGGGESQTTKGGYATGAPVAGKRGGTLTVVSRGDVDSLDPGAVYYQLSYLVTYATQRPLYSYRPQYAQAIPDLAVQTPQVTDRGRTVTVHLRQGVRFSPPVRRAVTSRDVKHAIERGFDPRVRNAYARAYFGSIVGADRARGGPIAGIQTPDPLTIVFRLARPGAATLIGALSLPLTAPVPPGAAPGRVATGPYMVRRYAPGREIELVRNPSWDRRSDFRPAYLDRIVVNEGNADPVTASRRILRGHDLVNAQGDLDVPVSILQQVMLGSAAQRRQFVAGTFTGGVRFVSLDTRHGPLRNVNVRRAIAAALDRRALRLRLGGPLAGDIPTHLLPPGIPGSDVAGGARGPGYDFLAAPGGDPGLAARYLVKAGYPSGRYTGGQTLTVAGGTSGTGRQLALLVRDQLERLGFQLTVADDPRLCRPSAQTAAICADGHWQPDFPEPQLLLSRWQPGPELVEPVERMRFWGYADRKVTAEVPAVPWLWDRATGIESRDVNGVVDRFGGGWDLSFTSLK